MTTTHSCPRRLHEMGPWPKDEHLDTWIEGHGRGVDPCCSFCGSLHPEKFLVLVEQGWIVGPTDKAYKAYLSQPASAEEKAERRARWLQSFTAREIHASAEERGDTPDQVREALEAVYDTQVAGPAEEGNVRAKFYFQHLDAEQARHFIDLYNHRRMNVGYPGHFYRLPYFMAPTHPEGD